MVTMVEFKDREHDASPSCNCCTNKTDIVISIEKEVSGKETLISLCYECFKKLYDEVNKKI